MRLFELISHSPHLKILLVTTHLDELAPALGEYLTACEGTMDWSLYPGEHGSEAAERLGKIDRHDDYSSPLRTGSREYEAAIVQDLLDRHHSPVRILQALYRSLENSAEIIVVQRRGSIDVSHIEALLEQAEFRAVNTIDDLVEGCDVTVAKKMHMWGNGL